ncbi:MAG TPA: HD domain-containing phosphohydrolase [Candidatus Limnocylindria bacterium]|nr:HD domain-containing phosphohydrolase [Candidatus Limnocylindria bacterium]
MTASRALAAFSRVRIAIALALLTISALSRATDEDVAIRALAGGLLFAAAAVIAEIAPRVLRKRAAALAAPVAEFWAAAVTVALLERYSEIAPALFVLPISTFAIVLRQIDVLAFAGLAAALVIEARLLRSSDLASAVVAVGWAVLYVAWAIVAGTTGSAIRRLTRRHDSAEAALPTLAAASSYDEIARITFAYLDHVTDGDGDAPAALLVDEDSSGRLVAVATRALDAEARARLRATADTDALPPPFARGITVRLRDAGRVVAIATVAGTAIEAGEAKRVSSLAAAAVTRVRAATRARRLAPPGTTDAKAWLTEAVREAAVAREVRVVRARDAGAAFREIVAEARRTRVASRKGRAAIQIGGEDLWLLASRSSEFVASDLQLLSALAEEAARLRERAGVEARVARLAAHIESEDSETAARLVDALRTAIESNQPQLSGSGDRVAAIADAIAVQLGCSEADRAAIHVAALVRDVGQLGIDRGVLDRPGALSSVEREIVERHPLLGESILHTLTFLAPAARIVRAHHERWDGSGYPDRLRADDIPRGASVLAVADAYVAMTAPRAHRAALRPPDALGQLLEHRGAHFDPAAVDALVSLAGTGALVLP